MRERNATNPNYLAYSHPLIILLHKNKGLDLLIQKRGVKLTSKIAINVLLSE